MSTKVEEAIRLVREEGMTAYAAAKALGIPLSSVYSAQQRAKLKELQGMVACPCCGSMVAKEKLAGKC